jgi:hypothetical protein
MRKKEECNHGSILVMPIEDRALGPKGLKDFRELLYYSVQCLVCKKEVARYRKHDAIRLIEKDFLSSLEEE